MKIMRKTLSDQLYESLKQDIVTHKIHFGEKLVNRELQQKYSVSSTPVRDAINRLYLDGLLENINNAGAKVINFDLKFILDVNEVISLLCCASVEKAAERAGHEKICRSLEEAIKKQKNVKNPEEYYPFDRHFHEIFFDYCGNSQFKASYDRYHVLWEMLVRYFHNFQDNQKRSIEQHQMIYDAFANKEFERAVELTKSHFLEAETLFKEHVN